MHLFYSFMRRSLDKYNEDNTLDENRFFMINAITLGKVMMELHDDFFRLVNPLWKHSLMLKSQSKDSMQYDMALNVLMNQNQGSFFKAMSQSSKFSRITLEAELAERKMTWDTY